MSYEVKYTSRFKRDYKRMQRRGKEMSFSARHSTTYRNGTSPFRFASLIPPLSVLFHAEK